MIERLETRIAFNVGPVAPPALDVDSPVLERPVYGPEIPDHINYIPRPVLQRTPSELELPAVLPTPTWTGVSDPDGMQLRDSDSALLFAAYAADGEINTIEARDWLVSMDDDTGYNRFEVGEARHQLNNSNNVELFTPESFYLLRTVVDNEVTYNDNDFVEVQEVADELFFRLSTRQ